MPHIQLPDEPGIIGPLAAYRATEKPLDALANVLMTGPSSLTKAEREMIATYVSHGNKCYFCTNSHAAAARHLLAEQRGLMDDILRNLGTAEVSPKLRALLVIAEKVRQGGRQVTTDDVEAARRHGADDQAIHDTVLITGMFCMFNRYVDGLATFTPQDPKVYDEIGARIATKGYGSRWRDQGE
jgi:uncharacterized peroxidase-related enzyme